MAAIFSLGFLKTKKLFADGVQRAQMHDHAKFWQNWSILYGYIALL